jgi:hypothetical protein
MTVNFLSTANKTIISGQLSVATLPELCASFIKTGRQATRAAQASPDACCHAEVTDCKSPPHFFMVTEKREAYDIAPFYSFPLLTYYSDCIFVAQGKWSCP